MFILCKTKDDFYCVLYLYRPVQQNVHRRCEPDSETLVGVTCGELLAIWIAGTFKGKIPSCIWYTYLSFLFFVPKVTVNCKAKIKISYL